LEAELIVGYENTRETEALKRYYDERERDRERERFMVFGATFNNISVIPWLSVLLVEETGVNHRPVSSYCHTLSLFTILKTT
jgi:hypothetical protein